MIFKFSIMSKIVSSSGKIIITFEAWEWSLCWVVYLADTGEMRKRDVPLSDVWSWFIFTGLGRDSIRLAEMRRDLTTFRGSSVLSEKKKKTEKRKKTEGRDREWRKNIFRLPSEMGFELADDFLFPFCVFSFTKLKRWQLDVLAIMLERTCVCMYVQPCACVWWHHLSVSYMNYLV